MNTHQQWLRCQQEFLGLGCGYIDWGRPLLNVCRVERQHTSDMAAASNGHQSARSTLSHYPMEYFNALTQYLQDVAIEFVLDGPKIPWVLSVL